MVPHSPTLQELAKKQKELTIVLFGEESPQMIDAHLRLGHSNIAIGLDAQAFLNFEKAFELSKSVHNGEENGSCVIALMNMAIAMRFMGNDQHCSQILDKCLKIEETINGKQTEYY